MNIKRKTVRFQDNLDDLAVYEAVSNYKKYGYRSESHMMIEAVRKMLCNKASDLDPEKLADLIAARLSGKLTTSSVNANIEAKPQEAPKENAAFDAALDFLNSL